LSRFDFMLKHVPGIRMGKVDRLSKRLDWKARVSGVVHTRVEVHRIVLEMSRLVE